MIVVQLDYSEAQTAAATDVYDHDGLDIAWAIHDQYDHIPGSNGHDSGLAVVGRLVRSPPWRWRGSWQSGGSLVGRSPVYIVSQHSSLLPRIHGGSSPESLARYPRSIARWTLPLFLPSLEMLIIAQYGASTFPHFFTLGQRVPESERHPTRTSVRQAGPHQLFGTSDAIADGLAVAGLGNWPDYPWQEECATPADSIGSLREYLRS